MQFCASMAPPEQPFHTCSVGIPLNGTQSIQVTQNIVKMRCSSQNNCNTKVHCRELWDIWDDSLPVASLKPQESDISGTLSAEGCVFFNYTPEHDMWDRSGTGKQNVTPSSFWIK